MFIDGTYKFFNIQFTLISWLFEVSIGRRENVGTAIVSSEDRQTLKWMVEMFKEHNLEACEKIRCFIGERSVLKEVFPENPIYLCLFHTLKSFSRAMADKKNGLR